MTDVATRNRQIKKVLTAAFGAGKVKVRGSRGTGYGWVSVDIDFTPLDTDQAQKLRGLAKTLLRRAGVDLGHSYTDDTCQYESDQCHISFNQPRYSRTVRHADGTMSVIRIYGDTWEAA